MVDQPRDNLGRFLSPDKNKSHLNFNSGFGTRLGSFLSAAEKAGHKISIYSGARSVARQRELFNKAVEKYGSVAKARKMVAPPGMSKHNLGLAADLDYGEKGTKAYKEALKWAHENAKKYGLNYRMSWENWHIEPLGKMGLGLAALADPNRTALPDTMTAPKTLAQTLAAEAMSLPSRPVSRPPPSSLVAAPVGQVTRASLPSIPSSLPAAPVGQVTRASLPSVPSVGSMSVNPSRFAYDAAPGGARPSAPEVGSLPAAPTRSLAHPVSVARPTNLPAAPVGEVTRGAALAAPAIDRSVSPSYPGELGGITMSSPTGNFSVPSLPSLPSVPAAPPPAIAAPPAQVLAPALAPPTVVRDYNVASLPSVPSAPRATAYDVYSGLADTAMDNTGQNTVTRNIDGTTSVTNKYGVTTTTMPDGKQAATGSLPSLPGIEGIGGKVTGAMPAIGGSLLGGALAGAPGALLGGLIAKAITQPGGIMSNMVSYNTNAFGKINAARPNASLNSFPDRPDASRDGYRGPASFSNRSQSGMRSISPGAAKAIGAGKGGLY